MELKVTVDKLNIRSSPANGDYTNWLGDLNKGEIINAQSIVVGDEIDGIKYWYKDEHNRYYWLGGTGVPNADLGWSLNSLGINHVWNLTKGAGVKVAIIDSGLAPNADLVCADNNRFNVLNNTKNINDSSGHGTGCSTILSSRGENKVFGVAPECEMICIKIMNEEDDLSEANKVLGIKKAVELGAEIISISFGTTSPNSQVNAIVKKYMDDGKIFIAAAGNKKNDHVNFPAKIKGVISVGNIKCINPEAPLGESIFQLSDKSPGEIEGGDFEGITIVAPGDHILTYGTDGRINSPSGTSFAAPYVAGVAALWLSLLKSKELITDESHQKFRAFISSNANKKHSDYNPQTWGNGVLNPLAILSI